MYIILDDNGYVKFLSTTTPMEGAIELSDDNELNLTYINCYKLNPEGTGLMLDAEKMAAQKDNLGAKSKIFELKEKLAKTDYKVLGRIREEALGTTPHMPDNQYLMLEAERESYVRKIRELEDGTKLVTDVSEILKEGAAAREEKVKQAQEAIEAINTTLPDIKEGLDKLTKSLNSEELIQNIVAKIKESVSLKDLFNTTQQSETKQDDSETDDAKTENPLDKLKDLFPSKPSIDKNASDVIENTDSSNGEINTIETEEK